MHTYVHTYTHTHTHTHVHTYTYRRESSVQSWLSANEDNNSGGSNIIDDINKWGSSLLRSITF